MMYASKGRLFTPTEAAVLTGLSLRVVNTAIDKKKTPVISGKWTGNAKRLFDLRALMLLTLERRFANRFRPDVRRELVDALETSTHNKIFLKKGSLTIDLREPRRELAASLRTLRRIRDLVGSYPDIMDSEPVFRGTRVPVHLIAILLGKGLDKANLLKMYPSLTAEMIQLTPIYAAAYPLRGRPKTRLWHDLTPTQDRSVRQMPDLRQSVRDMKFDRKWSNYSIIYPVDKA